MSEDPKAGDGGTAPEPKPEDAPVAPGRSSKELETELETVRGRAQRYSREAADRRAENKKLADEVRELRAQLAAKASDGAPAPTPDAGDPTPPPADDKAAQLQARVDQLEKEVSERDVRYKEREQQGKSRAHRAAIAALVARHHLSDPDDAIELLSHRTKLAEDETGLTFAAKNEKGEQASVSLTDENFQDSGLLGLSFWPAKGVPGSGGKETREFRGGVDVSRIGDRDYWKKNKEQLARQLAAEKG